MTRPGFGTRIVSWQRLHGRHDLPWQGTRDPYRVWLSEIMLQQTQVGTVLAYYARFLRRFPSVAELAAAPLDDVMAQWSGLGYYSRARHLHRCARTVMAEHGGVFPASAEVLATLPGIGRSTAAAIAAFCFGQRVAILDGNVKRVLSRWLGFEGDLAKSAQQEQLWAAAQDLLPRLGIDIYTQGLMDLGASVCTRKGPACDRCPVSADCVACASGQAERYPVKSRRSRRTQRENALLWLRHRRRVWLVQRPQKGVWAGLWTLPEFASTAAAEHATAGWLGQGTWLPPFKHALTHFDWTLHPLRWAWPERAAAPAALPPGRWFTLEEALALGLPAPIRRLLHD